MGWPTAHNVVMQAAVELGLVQSASEFGDDVFQSADPIAVQLCALLKKTGRDLVDEFEWPQLRAEWSIITESPTVASGSDHQTYAAYLLPKDWRALIAQSGWNRTNRLPMGGPLSEQEWQYLSSRLTGVVWTVLFRPMQSLLFVYPPNNVPDAQALTFAYKSGNWVQNEALVGTMPSWAATTYYRAGALVMFNGAGGTLPDSVWRCVQTGTSGTDAPDPAYATAPYVPTASGACADGSCQWNFVGFVTLQDDGLGGDDYGLTFGTADAPTAGDQLLMFEEELLVARLQLAWLGKKGFETGSEDDANSPAGIAKKAFESATSNAAPAPVLSLNRRGYVADKLLDGTNIPITNFGGS